MRNSVLTLAVGIALLSNACGASTTDTQATAESPDQPASEQSDTALGAPEAASDEPSSEASDETEVEPSEETETPEAETTDPNAPPPSDDLQAYVGTGAQSPEYMTVTANMDLIKRCYLDALSRNPDLQGAMIIKFTVNKKGVMTKAKAIENELTPEVGKCVVTTMKKLKFPKRNDSRTVEYPFKFFPSPTE